MISPHNATCRPTAAALHGRRSHTVDRGRGALIRMGGAPLVENRSLPFIRPPPSFLPSVKIGGGRSDGILQYIRSIMTVYTNAGEGGGNCEAKAQILIVKPPSLFSWGVTVGQYSTYIATCPFGSRSTWTFKAKRLP